MNDFYTIANQEHSPGLVKATIAINRSHNILKGHFPGHPVVPGVCMMQIIREALQAQIGKKLLITAADNIKFLAIINPEQNSEVEVSVNYTQEAGRFMVNATLFAGTVTFFKMKATLQPVE